MEHQLSLQAIPQPKPDPLLKNLKDLDPKGPVQGLMRLARTYGPIFRLSLPDGDRLVVSSQELVNELCDESRFDKKVHASLENIRAFAGDGLFTAYTQEPNWAKAHRILMPAFGPASIRGMFDPMLDIAEQMLQRWERFGEEAIIDVPDNMTRLTLDTIALCAFDDRFNSFYQNEMHPFVHAMVEALAEAGARGRRLSIQNQLMVLTKRQYEGDIHYMHQFADRLIARRKQNPTSKNDLLNRMLQGRDPITGEGLDDENIRYQMVTFLIAGHETTSGLLSFALYELLKNPQVLARARAHVDEVLGNDTPRFEHLAKLTYIDLILKEHYASGPRLRLSRSSHTKTQCSRVNIHLPKDKQSWCSSRRFTAIQPPGEMTLKLSALSVLTLILLPRYHPTPGNPLEMVNVPASAAPLPCKKRNWSSL